MPCRHLRFLIADGPGDEWVPMALRDANCTLRGSNPEKWNEVLRCKGVHVEDDDTACMHNLDGTWRRCPLFVERTAPKQEEDEDDVPRNKHGYPLII